MILYCEVGRPGQIRIRKQHKRKMAGVPQGEARLFSHGIRVQHDPVWVNKTRRWKVLDRTVKVIPSKPAVISHL